MSQCQSQSIYVCPYILISRMGVLLALSVPALSPCRQGSCPEAVSRQLFSLLCSSLQRQVHLLRLLLSASPLEFAAVAASALSPASHLPWLPLPPLLLAVPLLLVLLMMLRRCAPCVGGHSQP